MMYSISTCSENQNNEYQDIADNVMAISDLLNLPFPKNASVKNINVHATEKVNGTIGKTIRKTCNKIITIKYKVIIIPY